MVQKIHFGIQQKHFMFHLQNVRHECVVILSALVEEFPTNPAFANLTHLHDEDIEKDFFENIRHIQV